MNKSPDPYGQAALMLCESLLLLLIEDGTIRKQQGLEIVEDMIDVKRELAGTTDDPAVSLESIRILRSVGLSLSAAREPVANAS